MASDANANANANAVCELFDWIVNSKHVRGSRRGDLGLWMHNSAKPKLFNPKTRIVELDNGERYLIKKETICKALGMDKASEMVLGALPATIVV
jgi:hypothetical protein